MKMSMRGAAVIAAVIATVTPVANGQGSDSDEVKGIYSQARASMLGTGYAGKVQVTFTRGSDANAVRQTESFTERTERDRYSVTDYTSTSDTIPAIRLIGVGGRIYFPVAGEPDPVVIPEAPGDGLVFRPGSPLRLPEAGRIGYARFGDVPEMDLSSRVPLLLNLDPGTAREILARQLIPGGDISALASQIVVQRASLTATVVDGPVPRIVGTRLTITGSVPKDALAGVKGLWIVGGIGDLPLTLESTFTPTGRPVNLTIAAPSRSITMQALASTRFARTQIAAAVTAIEKYGVKHGSVKRMTAAQVRKIDRAVKLVPRQGTTAAGTVGYTMLDGGRRYALRVRAKNGWVYSAVRPLKASGKFTRTCTRPGGVTCGTW